MGFHYRWDFWRKSLKEWDFIKIFFWVLHNLAYLLKSSKVRLKKNFEDLLKNEIPRRSSVEYRIKQARFWAGLVQLLSVVLVPNNAVSRQINVVLGKSPKLSVQLTFFSPAPFFLFIAQLKISWAKFSSAQNIWLVFSSTIFSCGLLALFPNTRPLKSRN